MVSINMAMSIDGKIATKARGPVKLGSAFDTRRMREIRAEHDAVVNGSTTFRAHPFPLHVGKRDLVKARLARGLPSEPISAVVSSNLSLPRGTPWELARKANRWVFCGKEAPRSRRQSFEMQGVRVFPCRGKRPSAGEILKAFREAGAERVLLEGGGEFNASFLERGLVDRIYLTVAPLVIGGSDSPTWFEGMGFQRSRFPKFRLSEARQVGDELYLIYDRA